MNEVKKQITKILIKISFFWGCIWYDPKYLRGKCFSREYLSIGWKWIWQYWFAQKILRKNAHIPFPVPTYTIITNINNITFDLNEMLNFHMPGSYFQCINAHIYIGENTQIAPGVGIITSNHNIYDLSKSAIGKDVVIGNNCWIGMNSVILPGVILGDKTIVGAGGIVTKSFPKGHCIIAGNPAKIIRTI